MSKVPVFLERRNYRYRRMMDAIRLLPILGLMLWMVPLFWPVAQPGVEAAPEAVPMSVALKYLFGVWVLLVLASWLLWRRTGKGRGEPLQLEEEHPD